MKLVLRVGLFLVLFAILGFVVRSVLSGEDTAEVVPVDTYAVAATELPAALLLRDSDILWKKAPRPDVPEGAILEGSGEARELSGAVMRKLLVAGEPLTRADVIFASAPGFLSAALKPGLRAISVAIDEVSGSSGLIQPGDYVDLILIQTSSENGQEADPSRAVGGETIVKQVRVIAVGSTFLVPEKGPTEANSRARTVTLEVTQRAAEVVAVASRMGSLSLILRSFATTDPGEAGNRAAGPVVVADEGEAPEAQPIWAGDVSRMLAGRTPATARKEEEAPPAWSVRVFRGSKKIRESEDDFGGANVPPPSVPGSVPQVAGGAASVPTSVPVPQ